MIPKTLKHLKRAPLRAVAILLFSAVITLIICSLQASGDAALRHYEEAYESFPITVTVTNPSGKDTMTYVSSDGTAVELPDPLLVSDWVIQLFTRDEPVRFYDVSGAENPEEMKSKAEVIKLSLAEYVKDVQLKKSFKINKINAQDVDNSYLYGMTSLSCEPQLEAEITWKEGYDESIFEGKELFCLIPESKAELYDNGDGEVVQVFSVKKPKINGNFEIEYEELEYQYTLKIAGTYTGEDWESIYCPLSVVEQICREIESRPMTEFLSATLADGSRLDEFREKISVCFLEPAPDSDEIPWGFYANDQYNEFYPFALDITDENPYNLSDIKDRIEFNHRVTLIVLAASAIAAFVIDLLMIRRRKRDIMLMRTVGESSPRVCAHFLLEQMTCILLGMIVGGVCFLWKPIDKLLIFALICFVSFTLAIVIFMSKKLIQIIKED